jgi:hypothetical protein
VPSTSNPHAPRILQASSLQAPGLRPPGPTSLPKPSSPSPRAHSLHPHPPRREMCQTSPRV